MRKRLIVVVILVAVGYYQFGDELTARLYGTPVRLISSTGSLRAADGEAGPLPRFTHAFVRDDALHLVVRTYFHDAGPLAKPYLAVDEQGRGVLHIAIKPRVWAIDKKCEFLRQFEVAIPAAAWRSLKSLQVFRNGVYMPEVMPLDDAQYVSNLLRESQQQIALRDLSGATRSCG